MKQYVIGIDYGTDSCRALIVDIKTGEQIASAVSNYKRWAAGLYCDPQSNRYRQHPLDYIEALEQAVTQAVVQLPSSEANNIVGLGFDTTGSSPCLIDDQGMPLALNPKFAENPDSMFVLWKDHTAVAEAEQITSLAKRWAIDYTAYEGGTYSSEWAWAKVLHIMKTNPEMGNIAYSWIEHCDWMPALVTGTTATDKVKRSRCAAGHKAMWSEQWSGLPSKEFLGELNPALGNMRARFSEQTYTSDCCAGSLTKQWAQKLGLPEGIPVAVGALDAHMGAVGACAAPYVLTRIIGTSTCDVMIIDKSELGDKCIDGICGQVDGSVVPRYIGIEAGQSAFGDIYAWLKDVLAFPIKNLMPQTEQTQLIIDNIIPALSNMAEKIAITESAPVALDWMNGRRTPHANQNLKGAIMELTLGTTAPMIFRALVEATSFGSKAIIEHLKKEGVCINSINAVGGITQKSPFVMQVLADVLGMPIRVVRSEQACALGAAMFAAVVAGTYQNVEQAQAAMGSGYLAEYLPDADRGAIYEKLYEKYLLLGSVAESTAR